MADDEQFSLCWNNFNSNLSAGFHESLCRGDLVDVTLAAEGQFVKAHRLVLSVCSPYFRKMFTQMPANQHAFVFLKDVSHTALKDLIQFMYCGEVNVKQEALPAFISTAEALQIKGLTDSDPPASQSPTEPSTPTPQIQPISSPRVRQRTSTSRSFKIESVDDSGDDNKATQIVIQTSAPPPTQQQVIAQPQTQHLQPQTQQSQTHVAPQQIASTPTATTTTVVSHKRPAARSIGSVPHIKRTKSTIDPLDTTDAPTTGSQQITVQTSVVAPSPADTKTQVHQQQHQQQQHHQQQQQQNEPEYIDLPIELPTKSEPDYADDAADVEGGENEATYVEDDSYGELRYDESYFTENDEAGAATSVQQSGGAGTAGSGASATTSKALVKQQQSSSFTDTSYVDVADQANSDAQDTEILERKRYKVHSDEDRSKVVEAANRNDDWISMAASLGVNYKTAYHWVTSGRDKMLKRGGVKGKTLTVEEIDDIIKWIEENSSLTLRQLKMKVCTTFGKEVSTSTIGNYLQGRLYTIKNLHHLSANINSTESNAKRAEYVRALNTFIQAGKQIIYIDGINFNLLCRRVRGSSRSGCREVNALPAARGLSIHLMGAIATSGVMDIVQRRGCFTTMDACNWIETIIQRWVQMGNKLTNLVVVCDNVPYHSYLENNLNATDKVTILCLPPYSPMLNPIEIIWSKIKTYVKTKIGVPATFDHFAVEQRLSYMEYLIDEAKTMVDGADCSMAIHQTTFFHSDALSLDDMPVDI